MRVSARPDGRAKVRPREAVGRPRELSYIYNSKLFFFVVVYSTARPEGRLGGRGAKVRVSARPDGGWVGGEPRYDRGRPLADRGS